MIRVLLSSQRGEEVDVAADEDGLGDDRYGPANLKADFQTRPEAGSSSSRVISIIVRRNPTLAKSLCAASFRSAVGSTTQGAPRDLRNSSTASRRSRPTPRPRCPESTMRSCRTPPARAATCSRTPRPRRTRSRSLPRGSRRRGRPRQGLRVACS